MVSTPFTIHTCVAHRHKCMGVLPDVLVLAAPRHSHQNVIDEIEAGRSADIPLERREQ